MSETKPRIAVIGGSGPEGSGLALRWAAAKHPVAIGSRSAGRAVEAAAELNGILGFEGIAGLDNAAAASWCDIAVMTVPYAAQQATAIALSRELAGKILVDVTVPLVPPKVSQVHLPEAGSCVLALQGKLGEAVKVASAFQNVSAHKLRKLDQTIDCDVLVCADEQATRDAVIALAQAAGLRGIDAGPLRNSVVSEALTSVLIWINRKYKVPDAGVRISGLGRST